MAATVDELTTTARRLRDELARARFGAATPGAGPATADAAAMVRQLDDHVLPRLANLDAPALVVVGGSTGSGKSLLVNSLVGSDVTRPGVLRPTTTSPVLVHDADSAAWFGAAHVLPGLARVHEGEARGDHELRLVTSDAVPTGVALLDSPDIDSISVENRALAAELLAAADLWIFVTTAARYADAVPWEFLAQARLQGTPLVIVLNRVPTGAADTVKTHLGEMLAERGLGDTTIFAIDEQPLDAARLPTGSVAPLRVWLDRLGADQEARADAIRRSLRGSLGDLATRTNAVAAVGDEQLAAVAGLRTLARSPYQDALAQVRDDIGKGTLLKGEVLARWEELLGTGELLRQLRTGLGRLRDRITGALSGRPKTDVQFNGAVEHVVETLIRTRGDGAASEAATAWRAHPTGAALLASEAGAGFDRSSADLGRKAGFAVRAWQGHLLDLVRNVGGDRRTTGRVLSFGVNGAAIVVMMVVFSHTGGLTGAEVAVAGGAGAVGHTLLEALLGDQAVRTLAADARSDLEARVRVLYDEERARYDALLAAIKLDDDAPARLRALASTIAEAVRL